MKYLTLIALLFWGSAVTEPVPEYMKAHSQAYECYEEITEFGVPVDSWVITWKMATEWFPELGKDTYIVFQGRRLTVIPTPDEYTCRVWVAPKKRKK